MGKQVWAFLGLTFAVSWAIWLSALKFGAGAGSSEYVLTFGSVGPAAATILLSRNNQRSPGSGGSSRLICFIAVWLLACLVYVVNDSLRGVRPSSQLYRLIVGVLALLPACVVSGAFARDSGTRQLLQTLAHPRDFRWPAVGFFFFPVILLIPAAIVKMFGGALSWPQHRGSIWAYASHGAIFFLSSLLFTAALEEPGWRGFLLPHLQRRFSPLLGSILVWFPWALWHAPLDFSGGVGSSLITYTQVRVVFLIPIAIILTWLYNRSGGSLLAVALFHAGMNTFPFVLPYAPKMLALVFVVAAYVIFAQQMWRRETAALPLPAHIAACGDAE